jgi:putative membrane protein
MTKLPVRVAAVLAWLAGLALLVWLLSQVDLDFVFAAVRKIGMWGIALVIAFHAIPLTFDMLGWRLLFSRPRPDPLSLAWARWIGEAGNALLPGQAGEFLRVRAAMLIGAGGAAAVSSGIVDVTLGVIAQIAFSVLGLGLFAARVGLAGGVLWLAGGILALIAGVAGFVIMQHRGMFGALAPLVARWIARAPALAGSIDDGVRALWQRPGTIGWAVLWRFSSSIIGAGEVWLVFWLLGAEVSFADALALEALGQAARAAAFLIPSGLGVQETALVFLATALGIPPENAFALALVKRARELALAVPGLLAWQLVELRGRRRRAAAEAGRAA